METNPRGAPLGNQNAKKGKWFREALTEALTNDPLALYEIAVKLISMAKSGDMDAIKELANRIDGRVAVLSGGCPSPNPNPLDCV